MDQSASILSDQSLLYISFFPSLNATPAPLPSKPSVVFVIANSLTVSNKAETGKHRYNLRVVETLVGARILAKILGLPIDDRNRKTYREVLGEWWTASGNIDDEAHLADAIKALLDSNYLERLKGGERDGLTLDEMVEGTGLDAAKFHELFLSWVDGETVPTIEVGVKC